MAGARTVTIIDASTYVDSLVVSAEMGQAARAWLRTKTALQVPGVFPAEVTSALRAMVLQGDLHPIRADTARQRLQAVRLVEYPFAPFAERVWQLRNNLSVYDAWYVALAESLDMGLVTSDARLVNTPGPRCNVRHVLDARP